MKFANLLLIVLVAGSVTACGRVVRQGEEYLAYNEEAIFGVSSAFRGRGDKTYDVGLIDRDSLEGMRAGIWVDPNGCEHWIIDDGVEGYLSQRLHPDGRPVCGSSGQPTYAYGNFKIGATNVIGDSQ